MMRRSNPTHTVVVVAAVFLALASSRLAAQTPHPADDISAGGGRGHAVSARPPGKPGSPGGGGESSESWNPP